MSQLIKNTNKQPGPFYLYTLGFIFVGLVLIVWGIVSSISHKTVNTKEILDNNNSIISTIVYKTMEVYLFTPTNTQSSPPSLTPSLTNTNAPSPTTTLSPTNTFTPQPSISLLSPENGADLPASGFVRFSWSTYPGTKEYILTIIQPNNKIATFSTIFPLYDRYIESFFLGGRYTWKIFAKDEKGNIIFTSNEYYFDRPQGTPIGLTNGS